MTHKNGKKIMIFGNGGYAPIACRFSVNLTKNAKLRDINYNKANLITCFSNDYSYENWIKIAYNIVENIYQTWLLSTVDVIIGKKNILQN
jgi:phosphoheptose isomerase|tara:strand:- start:231 stop:500 length:270 start_codon:yes stop_codon:yes gene_type:complete